jgi:hypothetical protein
MVALCAAQNQNQIREWRREAPPFSYRTNRKTLKALQSKAFKVFLGLGLSAKRCI